MDKSVLQKATLDNDEPCAAWMFKAIANMTKTSPKSCEDIVQWLVTRLNSTKSPTVKKKCLNIIRSVATHGDPEFARQIIRQSEEIKKNASTYTRFDYVLLCLLCVSHFLFFLAPKFVYSFLCAGFKIFSKSNF